METQIAVGRDIPGGTSQGAPLSLTPAHTDAVTRTHHKYGPSKLGYLKSCAAYSSKDGTSEAAEQGTFLHEIMDKMLKAVATGKAKNTTDQIKSWVLDTHELQDDEIGLLYSATRRCDVWIAKKPRAIHTEIDVRVAGPDRKELNHGFLDVLFDYGKVGILVDFKFGWVPVTPAGENLQGQNYALGCFRLFPALEKIGVEFIQPKLNWISSTVFHRAQQSEIFDRLSEVINRAEFVQANPDDPKVQGMMMPGKYCDYCSRAGVCTKLTELRGRALAHAGVIPLPVSFRGLELKTPQDVALARHWVDLIETAIDGVKQRAFEMAESSENGEISCTLPNGDIICYAMAERNSDRSLGNAAEVAEALKEVVSPAEILGAAELAIGRLESITKTAMVDLAKMQGKKLTKKAAWEQISATLEANGLLTRPDKKIRYLKQVKKIKQIES